MSLLDCPPPPVAPSVVVSSQNRLSPMAPEGCRKPTSDAKRGEWWVLAGFWVLAIAAVGLCSWNFLNVTGAGVRQEQMARASIPDGTPGKGRSAALASHAPTPMLDADSFCWIDLVQREASEGDLRNRRFPYDNAPTGRELHWSGSFAWWMLLLAAPVRVFGGLPWPEAIAVAAPWANPVLFALALTTLGLVIRRRVGVWAAGILMVTLATCWGVEWDFCFGRPDHHGLHLIAFLGMLLCALGAGLGWVRVDGVEAEERGGTGEGRLLTRPMGWKAARRAFAWSGSFGATGLWIGATQQMFVIGAVGTAAALGSLIFVRAEAPGEHGAVRFVPALWRVWARTGALASLGFYLLEYFPSHMGMRLEVNHPLYALAWWGGGELIFAAGEWARLRGRWASRAAWTRVGAGMACTSVLPVAVLAGPSSWYVVRDPILLRIMQTVAEGQPFIAQWTPLAIFQAAVQTGVVLWLALPLGAGLLAWRWRRGALTPWRALGIWVALGPAVLCLAGLCLQRRWLGFESAALAVLALMVAPDRGGKAAGMRWGMRVPLGLLALTVPGWLVYAVQEGSMQANKQAGDSLGSTLAMEEVAWNLRMYQQEAGRGTAAAGVIGPLGSSTTLHYYGGVVPLGSLYWENVAGCREQMRFLDDDAPGEPAARRIARERGLEYVVVISDPQRVLQVQWVDRGKTDRATLGRTLVFRLANPVHATPPDWLEPLPLLDAPLAVKYGARLYRVRRERL